jgi:glycosyltransferase involved in cell wall biosynthesis
MRILILGTVMDQTQGGANQALLSFANGLADHPSLKPVIFVYSYDPKVIDPSLPVFQGRAPQSPRFLWRFPSTHFVSQLRDSLRESRIPEVDVAFCVSLHIGAAFKKLRPNTPLITNFGPLISAREVMEEFPAAPWARRIEAALIDRIEKWVYQQPRSAHIAQTKLVAEARQKHFGLPEHFFTIQPCGINDALFSRSNVKLDIRRKWNIPAGAFVIATVARLVSWKRVEMVIEAMDRMDSNTFLLVVGQGPDRESLEAKAGASSARERIVFAGWSPKPSPEVQSSSVVDWLAAADVFVLTSRIESFGLVYAEAMMLGLPCIGSMHEPPSVTSAASDVIPEGKAGFCVDSVDMLVDRLRLLQTDPDLRMQMGGFAHQLATTSYTVKSFIECFEREARSLMAQPVPVVLPQ